MSVSADVAIIMGSQSDWETMRHAADTLEALGISFDARIVSAHRTPDRLVAFAKGDIATARAFFVSAASAGDARALVALGDTFDPATLTHLGVVGLKGDEAKARDYYSRAVTAGAPGARERVASLASK